MTTTINNTVTLLQAKAEERLSMLGPDIICHYLYEAFRDWLFFLKRDSDKDFHMHSPIHPYMLLVATRALREALMAAGVNHSIANAVRGHFIDAFMIDEPEHPNDYYEQLGARYIELYRAWREENDHRMHELICLLYQEHPEAYAGRSLYEERGDAVVISSKVKEKAMAWAVDMAHADMIGKLCVNKLILDMSFGLLDKQMGC